MLRAAGKKGEKAIYLCIGMAEIVFLCVCVLTQSFKSQEDEEKQRKSWNKKEILKNRYYYY